MKLKVFIFKSEQFVEELEIDMDEKEKVYELLSVVNKGRGIEYEKVSVSTLKSILNINKSLEEAGLTEGSECFIKYNPKTNCCNIY